MKLEEFLMFILIVAETFRFIELLKILSVNW
nr:MAG TPA: hypothetical protein [Caudoviricetes sp.]